MASVRSHVRFVLRRVVARLAAARPVVAWSVMVAITVGGSAPLCAQAPMPRPGSGGGGSTGIPRPAPPHRPPGRPDSDGSGGGTRGGGPDAPAPGPNKPGDSDRVDVVAAGQRMRIAWLADLKPLQTRSHVLEGVAFDARLRPTQLQVRVFETRTATEAKQRLDVSTAAVAGGAWKPVESWWVRTVGLTREIWRAPTGGVAVSAGVDPFVAMVAGLPVTLADVLLPDPLSFELKLDHVLDLDGQEHHVFAARTIAGAGPPMALNFRMSSRVPVHGDVLRDNARVRSVDWSGWSARSGIWFPGRIQVSGRTLEPVTTLELRDALVNQPLDKTLFELPAPASRPAGEAASRPATDSRDAPSPPPPAVAPKG